MRIVWEWEYKFKNDRDQGRAELSKAQTLERLKCETRNTFSTRSAKAVPRIWFCDDADAPQQRRGAPLYTAHCIMRRSTRPSASVLAELAATLRRSPPRRPVWLYWCFDHHSLLDHCGDASRACGGASSASWAIAQACTSGNSLRNAVILFSFPALPFSR